MGLPRGRAEVRLMLEAAGHCRKEPWEEGGWAQSGILPQNEVTLIQWKAEDRRSCSVVRLCGRRVGGGLTVLDRGCFPLRPQQPWGCQGIKPHWEESLAPSP